MLWLLRLPSAAAQAIKTWKGNSRRMVPRLWRMAHHPRPTRFPVAEIDEPSGCCRVEGHAGQAVLDGGRGSRPVRVSRLRMVRPDPAAYGAGAPAAASVRAGYGGARRGVVYLAPYIGVCLVAGLRCGNAGTALVRTTGCKVARLADATRASAAPRCGMPRCPCPWGPPGPGRSHGTPSTSGRGRARTYAASRS